MFVLQQKLKLVKKALGDWARTKFRNGSKLSATMKARLSLDQEMTVQNPDDMYAAGLENELSDQYIKPLVTKENMKKQQLGQKWDALGDRNSKYMSLSSLSKLKLTFIASMISLVTLHILHNKLMMLCWTTSLICCVILLISSLT